MNLQQTVDRPRVGWSGWLQVAACGRGLRPRAWVVCAGGCEVEYARNATRQRDSRVCAAAAAMRLLAGG